MFALIPRKIRACGSFPAVAILAITLALPACQKRKAPAEKQTIADQRAPATALEWTNASLSHPLTFFMSNSCWAPPPQDRLVECERRQARLKPLVRVGQLSIYDLNYYSFDDREPGGDDAPIAKSILAALPSGMYREVHFQDSDSEGNDVNERIWPTEVVALRDSTVLRSRHDVGGIYGIFEEQLISVSEGGVKFMKMDSIYAAAKNALPRGSSMWDPTTALNFEDGFWQIGTWEDNVNAGPKVACCTGHLIVNFRVESGNFVAINAKYQRDPQEF